MSKALFRSMLMSHGRTMIGYGFGMAIYQWLFIWVYPTLTKSSAMNSLLQSMPQGLMKVIGYNNGIGQLTDYLAGEFYGLIYIIVFAIFAITISTKLVAHLVDNLSMAYLLSTPVSRVRLAVTQAATLVTGAGVIALLCTVGGILGSRWFAPHSPLDTGKFIQLNLVGFLLFVVICAYAFLFSCVSRDERASNGLSAGLTLVFYALNTVGLLATHLSWMRRLSIFSAFNPQNIVHGQAHVVLLCISLAIGSILLFAAAVAGFRRRELAL
ncbi:ABC transporter permease subunit [Alicyclobacillus curvatus]|nr:ABC transporter permease subunit [Alicyclobacillus curvatus]